MVVSGISNPKTKQTISWPLIMAVQSKILVIFPGSASYENCGLLHSHPFGIRHSIFRIRTSFVEPFLPVTMSLQYRMLTILLLTWSNGFFFGHHFRWWIKRFNWKESVSNIIESTYIVTICSDFLLVLVTFSLRCVPITTMGVVTTANNDMLINSMRVVHDLELE